ncbi:MAG: hypothetical protein Q7J85_09445 [Bacillota bacterium]|nr:hypothetical protein [Bacillota bacterium]
MGESTEGRAGISRFSEAVLRYLQFPFAKVDYQMIVDDLKVLQGRILL